VLDADLSLLVFSDIPSLVTQHYRDYRQAASKASTSYAAGGALSLQQLFHQQQPHMAISSDGTIDEEYFRQVFDHILRECLPAEDYAPEAERFIVREVMLKVVVKDVIPHITQPWFLQKMMLDMLGPSGVSEQPSVSSTSASGPARLSKSSVVVVLLSAIQRLSGTCIALIHAYKQIVYMIPIVNQTQTRPTRMALPSLEDDSPAPTRSSTSSAASFGTSAPEIKYTTSYPDLTRGPLEMMSEVLCARERLATAALFNLVSLLCCGFQTFMNKLLCYLLYTHVLSASCMLHVVRASKRTLFPNGYPVRTVAEPTAEEQVAIRTQLVQRLAEGLPRLARSVVLGDGAAGVVSGAVDVLSDEACNRHLAVFVLDALVLSLFP